MRLICMWCAVVAVVATAAAAASAAGAQDDYYAPQTFDEVPRAMFRPIDTPRASSQRSETVGSYNRAIFSPAGDVLPQGSSQGSQWKAQPYNDYGGEQVGGQDEWRASYNNKEKQASILHHKQSLSSEGAFRFEYASDTGLQAGEVISPDGSRVGAYQYKDPAGQLVKLKYRAGKEGFQILEGSHVPKTPESAAPQTQSTYYPGPYQREQQSPDWRQVPSVPAAAPPPAPVPQYYSQNWKTDSRNEGQYNELEDQNRGPHSFGTGFAFAFKG